MLIEGFTCRRVEVGQSRTAGDNDNSGLACSQCQSQCHEAGTPFIRGTVRAKLFDLAYGVHNGCISAARAEHEILDAVLFEYSQSFKYNFVGT
jgi:hypothetical protein